IQIGWSHPGIGECHPGGSLAQRSRGFVLAGNIALADARTLHDPGIGSIDNAFQLLIGYRISRQRLAYAAYHRSDHHVSFPASRSASSPGEDVTVARNSISARILSIRRLRTMSYPISIAA